MGEREEAARLCERTTYVRPSITRSYWIEIGRIMTSLVRPVSTASRMTLSTPN